jgi:2-C-methyl-D-erythritol 4-phosphate cytidylyltransferase
MPTTCAIVPAAGRGLRMGGCKPKQFLEIAGKPILLHTIETLAGIDFIAGIYVVLPPDFLDEARVLIESADGGRNEWLIGSVTLVAGGAERQDSVCNALEQLPSDCEWVLIHDGVRPFVTRSLCDAAWRAAQQHGAAITAVPATDTIKRVKEQRVVETLPRDEIWLVQTPQVFRKDLLLEAYRTARREGWIVTDDASLLERSGRPVAVVLGERSNIKVTTPEDLAWSDLLFLGKG